MRYDFSGYATKNNRRCADGRIIRRDAFADNDGKKVPLVWSHQHKDPDLVLGHALLENREDGVYAYGFINEDVPKGKTAKALVKHGDVDSFSIFANRLTQDGPNVVHGNIVEVSLVLSGANPGAKIENAVLNHGDGMYEDLEDEATIFNSTNIDSLGHSDEGSESFSENKDLEHADDEEKMVKIDEEVVEETDDEKTIGDILEEMTPEQRNVVEYLVGIAVEQGSDEEVTEDEEIQNGGNTVKHNAFEDDGADTFAHVDSQGLFDAVMEDAVKQEGRFKAAFLRHAEEFGVTLGDNTDTYADTIAHADDSDTGLKYGMSNPEVMFPNATWLTPEPGVINYDQDWVNKVINGIGKTPFSRVRTHDADIRIEEARARGYVKANEKAEQFYSVAKRETTPTTVYTKQKFNKDDIDDITSFNVVNFTRTQIMRPKLNEEIARAILFGDGRSASSNDKINENNIRPVILDDEHYSVHTVLGHDESDIYALIEDISNSHDQFKGKGTSTFFTTFAIHNKMKWAKDKNNRRVYSNGDSELVGDLNVNEIVEVDTFMDNLTIDWKAAGDTSAKKYRVLGIKIALNNYNVGTDRGGNIFNAEDFDIDFNQYKFLMETRMSGALTKFHSAQVFLYPVATGSSASTQTGGGSTTETQGK